MIWGGPFTAIPDMLRRRFRRPPTRGETLRRAMRTAEGGRPVTEDDFADVLDAQEPERMRVYPGGRERIILKDGTPYEESGADENDWRL